MAKENTSANALVGGSGTDTLTGNGGSVRADKVTQTDELWLELSDQTEQYKRTLRVDNPRTDTYTTLAEVTELVTPSFFPQDSDNKIVPLFFDDADNSVGLTKLLSVQRVITMKTVRQYA